LIEMEDGDRVVSVARLAEREEAEREETGPDGSGAGPPDAAS